MPHMLGSYMDSMFFVSRELVRSRPRTFYENALRMVNGTAPLLAVDTEERVAAASERYSMASWQTRKFKLETMVLERLWHVIFRQEPLLPTRPSCIAA